MDRRQVLIPSHFITLHHSTTHFVMESTRHAPEHQRAIQMFTDAINNPKECLEYTPMPSFDTLCFTDNRFFTREEIKTKALPRGKDWWWNKNRSYRIIFNGRRVEYYKLSTRKVNAMVPPPPGCKLWVFYIDLSPEDSIEKKRLTFVWCEKGLESIKILPVTLQDLAFLGPFTTPTWALAFGWNH